MPRRALDIWFALLGCSLVALACDDPPDEEKVLTIADSETHWLASCADDSACGGNGLTCVCGQCTLRCGEDASTCDRLPDATCVDAGSIGVLCGGMASVPICAPACADPARCDAFTAELTCVGGTCALPTACAEVCDCPEGACREDDGSGGCACPVVACADQCDCAEGACREDDGSGVCVCPAPACDAICDCTDGECREDDGSGTCVCPVQVDPLELEFVPPVDTLPSVADDPTEAWSGATLGGVPYAALADPEGVVVHDLATGAELVTLPFATEPRLFASPRTDRLVLFYLNLAPGIGSFPPNLELHAATIDSSGGIVVNCLSCTDEMRFDDIADYAVALTSEPGAEARFVDAGCPADGPLATSCRWTAAYLRGGTLTMLQASTEEPALLDGSLAMPTAFTENTGLASVSLGARGDRAALLMGAAPQNLHLFAQRLGDDATSGVAVAELVEPVPATVGASVTILRDDAGVAESLSAIVDGASIALVQRRADASPALQTTPLTPLTAGATAIRDLQLVTRCERTDGALLPSAVLAYTVETVSGTAVEVALVGFDGATLFQLPTVIPGRAPSLRVGSDGTLRLGALTSTDGAATLLGAGEAGTPASWPIGTICE